jgi:hypothetical protein
MMGYGCIFEAPLDIQSVLSKRELKVPPLYSSLKARGDEGGLSGGHPQKTRKSLRRKTL